MRSNERQSETGRSAPGLLGAISRVGRYPAPACTLLSTPGAKTVTRARQDSNL